MKVPLCDKYLSCNVQRFKNLFEILIILLEYRYTNLRSWYQYIYVRSKKFKCLSFLTESFVHDSDRALEYTEYGYPKGSPNKNS
jgi:hypothetical protein